MSADQTQQHDQDLLPCPFCGCKAPKVSNSWISGWDIECALCSASPTGNMQHSTYEAAKAVWNTRAENRIGRICGRSMPNVP